MPRFGRVPRERGRSDDLEAAKEAASSADPRDELVLEEARRAIDQQKKDLEGLRVRATGTVGFSTVIASVVAGLSLRGAASITLWTWLALASLVAVAVLSVYVLAPRTLTFAMDVKSMDGWIENGDGISQMMRSVSLGFHENFNTNKRVLDRMHRAYLASIIAVLAEVALLFIDLAGR